MFSRNYFILIIKCYSQSRYKDLRQYLLGNDQLWVKEPGNTLETSLINMMILLQSALLFKMYANLKSYDLDFLVVNELFIHTI